jgi:hypothetical protein
MACSEGTTNFKIQNGPADGIIANTENINVCNATKILEHLHKSFTEQYVASTVWTGGQTPISIDVSNNPTFWLRSQPTLASFNTLNGLTGSNAESAGSTTNRLYEILFKQLDESNQGYRSAIHAIMTGVYNSSVSQADYLNVPDYGSLTLSASPKENFKGLYGLIHANNLLEAAIAEKVSNLRQGNTTPRTQTDTKSYNQRKNIKTTMEEIAYQENKIYREKFLNIILMVVGIFIVCSQLTQVFSPGGGGGGSGGGGDGGFGGIGGWLSNRFGSGSGGLFSRFGGLGLGSSGRSRVGNLFTSSPYSLSKRE